VVQSLRQLSKMQENLTDSLVHVKKEIKHTQKFKSKTNKLAHVKSCLDHAVCIQLYTLVYNKVRVRDA